MNKYECQLKMEDSREKLEADVRQILHSAYILAWMHGNENRRGSSFKKLYVEFYNLLDRQAAITERELCKQCDWPSLAAQPDLESQERIAELTAQVDELAQQLINARADCEHYRELFSKAITQAAEIVNLQP